MFNRWYDKYPDLKQLLTLLESIDPKYSDVIAQDFLQIVTEKYKDKFDFLIKQMSDNAPPAYSRWYDKNYDLHTCIELIKILDDNEKKELIQDYIMSLVSFITNVDDE